MDPKQPIRISHLLGAAAIGLVSATAFAQTPVAPAPSAAPGVPPGYTQIQPPKDPLVERREARAQARAEYKEKKSEARSEYKQEVGSAKQERRMENKAADATARQELAPPPKQ